MDELDGADSVRALVSDAIKAYESDLGHELPADLKSDVRLARFLFAWNGDPGVAAEQYKKMLQYRRDKDVDKLRREHFGEQDLGAIEQTAFPHWEALRSIGEYGPWYDAGRSYGGHLVHLEVVNRTDPTCLIEAVPGDKILEHHIAMFETRSKLLDELSLENGRWIQTMQVRDLSKFGIEVIAHAQAMIVLQSIVKTGNGNYPETCKKAIFVNTPASFHALWKVINPLLREKTRKKVIFMKDDYHRELLQFLKPRSIHRLEKMRMLKDHKFMDEGMEQDDIPRKYEDKICVTAGYKKYASIWMTRSGPRSKLKLTVLPAIGAKTDTPPVFTLDFVTSKADDSQPDGANITEVMLQLPNRDTGGEGYEYTIEFPADLVPDPEIDSGFLLVNFDNTAAWMYSITVPLKMDFFGTSK
mmetsp:Transcript_20086/g.33166  ORF Transcript_20086/g.33166 Transcript_20086/m.33166 type:complete len:414 (-) Transcript_20086:50-1291(-)